jgi:hypothetical protein
MLMNHTRELPRARDRQRLTGDGPYSIRPEREAAGPSRPRCWLGHSPGRCRRGSRSGHLLFTELISALPCARAGLCRFRAFLSGRVERSAKRVGAPKLIGLRCDSTLACAHPIERRVFSAKWYKPDRTRPHGRGARGELPPMAPLPPRSLTCCFAQRRSRGMRRSSCYRTAPMSS